MSYTILSFCGGGMRGLFSVTLLERLFRGQTVSADLWAGCSTGSTIISWLLNGETPEAISQKYRERERDFYSRQATDPQAPAYDIGLGLLGQTVMHRETKVNDVDQKILLASFNIGSQLTKQWGGSIFTNLYPEGTPVQLPQGSTTTVSGNITIADAVMASGAMPGMFGSINVKVQDPVTGEDQTYTQIDGAFLNHDPTLAAVAAVVDSGAAAFDDINVICFGTGLIPAWIASDTSKWGAYQWFNGDGNPNSQTQVTLINGTVCPMANLCFTGVNTTQWQDLTAMMMPGRFVYLNAAFDRIIDENDVNPADLDYMVERALEVDISAAEQLLQNVWTTGPPS
ncbi:MAG: hypothetical protein QOD63_207 [Actinomycetota bacterium]|jgi:patatin-like phospholipase/acyl hydrolase|nr:hypothetical protein [Actinomycetota bacterium]